MGRKTPMLMGSSAVAAWLCAQSKTTNIEVFMILLIIFPLASTKLVPPQKLSPKFSAKYRELSLGREKLDQACFSPGRLNPCEKWSY
jgi:hypothetical protein